VHTSWFVVSDLVVLVRRGRVPTVRSYGCMYRRLPSLSFEHVRVDNLRQTRRWIGVYMDGDGDHTFASQGHERASLGGAQVLGRETQVLPWDTFFKAYRTTHFSALNERVSCGWVGGRTQFEMAGTIWKSKQKPRNSIQKQLSRHISDSHEKHARMVSKTIECGTSRPHNVMRTHFESAGTIWKSKQKLSNLMQKQLHRPKGIHMQGTFDCRKKAFRQGRHDHRRCSHSSNCKV
jgi:hypothetical protein